MSGEIKVGAMLLAGSAIAPAQLAALSTGATPEPPKTAQPKMSAEFDAAIMKMLATLPEKRFQNAAELRSELERIAKGNLVGV